MLFCHTIYLLEIVGWDLAEGKEWKSWGIEVRIMVEEELEEKAMQGDMLMVRRLLWSQMQPLDDTQRGNILHIICTITGKFCSLIVDGGIRTNVAKASVQT